MCEAVRSGIGISGPSTKLACNAAGLNYKALKIVLDGQLIIQLRKMEKAGWTLYFATLHFEGLNKGRYGAL